MSSTFDYITICVISSKLLVITQDWKITTSDRVEKADFDNVWAQNPLSPIKSELPELEKSELFQEIQSKKNVESWCANKNNDESIFFSVGRKILSYSPRHERTTQLEMLYPKNGLVIPSTHKYDFFIRRIDNQVSICLLNYSSTSVVLGTCFKICITNEQRFTFYTKIDQCVHFAADIINGFTFENTMFLFSNESMYRFRMNIRNNSSVEVYVTGFNKFFNCNITGKTIWKLCFKILYRLFHSKCHCVGVRLLGASWRCVRLLRRLPRAASTRPKR